MVAAPATAMKAQIRCTGRRKSGEICDYLLARLDIEEFKGVIELRCPKCHTVAIFH